MKFQIPLAPGAVTQFLLRVVVCLILLSSLSQLTVYFFPDFRLGHYFSKVFNVNYEANVPSFYSFFTLLFSSLLLGAIAHAKNLESCRYKNHWKILSFIFLSLFLDEALELHEQLMGPTGKLINATGFFYYSWILPVGFLVAIFLLSYSKFLFHLPLSTRKFFVAACALYIGGAIGMEMPGGYLASTMGTKSVPYLIVMTIEESLEMLGIVVFIHALMSYIKIYLGGVSWNIYIEGKKTQVTETPNIGIPALGEPANRNLSR
jgi:hypothetical protein